MTKTKLRTFTNLGALPPGKQMVMVEHTYNKTYTDYFYTVVDTDGNQLKQVRDRMACGYMESYDSDEDDEEDGIISVNAASYDVNDYDMRKAVNLWHDYEEDSS